MEDLSACSVCFNEFDELSRIPKYLTCHHTFCIICITSMSNTEKKVICPLCRKETLNSTLPTNNEVLHLVKQAKVARVNTQYLELQESMYQHLLQDIKAKIESKKIEIAETKRQKQLVVNTSKIKLSSPDVLSNTVHKRLKHSHCSTLEVSSKGHLKNQKRISTKSTRHGQVGNLSSSTLYSSISIKQPTSIKKLNIRKRSKKSNNRHDKDFRRLKEDSATNEYPSCSTQQNDPMEMKVEKQLGHKQLKRLKADPKYGITPQSRAKREYDRLQEVISAHTLVIKQQSESITALTQDLLEANRKIQQLETSISENH